MKNLISKVAEGYIANKTKSYAIESQQNSAADSEIPKIHLDLGESLIGPSANVDVKLKSLTGKDLLDYPDTVLEQLKTNIAEFYNTPKRNVILGTGSDGIIETIPRLFVNPSDLSIGSSPDFFRFEDACKRVGGKFHFVERDEHQNYAFTQKIGVQLAEAIRELNPKLVWLSTPNNPTGQVAPLELIREVQREAANKDCILIVDEAYGEFNDSRSKPYTAVDLINEGAKQLIVLRTFSKAYGLAGARTGYGIVSNDIAEDSIFTKWNLPYDSNNIGAILAPLVLEDQEHMQFVREETNRLRTQIEDAINSNSNLHYVRGSVTNTLIAKCKNPKFKLVTELANNGMVVCDQDRYMGTGGKGYSRITVGRENEVKTLCDALREFRG